MTIRAAAPADSPAVDAVVAAAFGAHGPRVLEMMHRLDATEATRLDLVADEDDDVVGHVRLSRAWIDASERLVEILMLTPLAVEPSRQSQGIGTLLLDTALAAADAAHSPAVVLEGSPGFYARRGFVPAASHGLLRPSRRIPEPAFQVAPLSAHLPWMVGRVVYPEAMWQTDTVGLRDPELEQLDGPSRS
ncbi:GNAT family N-acetyltransferase [Luteimicrobium sp. NPDC057192]|uniref:GNAT family N-acetyltransferase n=1 Tax=Luteimicrobium sp. NPDC057192 TaxID=3346042 RepID=UPI0036329BA1